MGISHRERFDWRDSRIEILNITSRGYNALLRAKITTMGQANNLSHEMLLHLNGLGELSVSEIETELEQYIANPHAYPIEGQPLADEEAIALLANTPLSALDISKYAHNALTSSGITTVGHLAALTDSHLKKLTDAKRLGDMRREEIENNLANYLDEHLPELSDHTPTSLTESSTNTNPNQIQLAVRFKNTPISSLNLSLETVQFLSSLNFHTVGQLYTPAPSQLSSLSDMSENQRMILRNQFRSFLRNATAKEKQDSVNVFLRSEQLQADISVPDHNQIAESGDEHNNFTLTNADEKPQHPPLDSSIEPLGLFPQNIKNTLIRNGILTLRILMWHTSGMLQSQIRHLGDLRITEIETILAQWGWHLSKTSDVRKIILANLLVQSFYNIEYPLPLSFLVKQINQRNRINPYTETEIVEIADWHPYIEIVENDHYQLKLRTMDLPPHSLSPSSVDISPPATQVDSLPPSQKEPLPVSPPATQVDSLPSSQKEPLPVSPPATQVDSLPSSPKNLLPILPPSSTTPYGEIQLTHLWSRWTSSLDERQRNILFWHYGTNGDAPLTLAEISLKIDLSRERVRQIEVDAFKTLRSPNKKPFWKPLQKLIDNGIESGDGLLYLEEWEQLLDKHALWSNEDTRPTLLSFLSTLFKGYTYLDHYQIATYSHITVTHIRELENILKKILQEHKQSGLDIQELAAAIAQEKFPEVMYTQRFLARATELFERVGLEEDGRYHYSRKNKKPDRPIANSGWAGEPGTRLHEWELKLRTQFEKTAWIGQLLFTENEFHELCQVIQEEAIEPHLFTKKIDGQPRLVPPAVFMTSMIFSARYTEHRADEDVNEFWTPYLRDVWNVPYTQAFMSRCRKRFVQIAPYLEEVFNFVFPRRQTGDVVRPVYRHALIPRYMQADFASWLHKNWRDILEVADTPSLLASQLKNDKSLELYHSHRLQQFVTSKATAETATVLVINMVTAISLHINDGESIENITLLLSATPIEQELWQELAQVFNDDQDVSSYSLRQTKPRLTWVWSLGDEEMHLRVQNIILPADSEIEGDADRIVWLANGENDPLSAEIEEDVSPWWMETGEQIVNDVLLAEPDAPLDGQIMLLTDMDEVAIQLDVPPFPNQDIQFFRLTQQEAYGIPVDTSQVDDGTWLVCSRKPLSFLDENAQQLALDTELSVPYPLTDKYQWAAQLKLTLPISIQQAEKTILKLGTRHTRATISTPMLMGKQQVEGLSKIIPPVFRTTQLSLTFAYGGKQLIKQAVLWLRGQDGWRNQWSLIELQAQSVAELTDDKLVLNLTTLLPSTPNVYTAELRFSLTPILQSPVQFAIVPNLRAEQPDKERLYTPVNPPQIRLYGVDDSVIVSRKGMNIDVMPDNSRRITWTDLKRDPHLLLRFEKADISLAWDMPRFTAWLEPKRIASFFTLAEIQKTILHVKSTHATVTEFHLFVEGERYRSFSLRNSRYTQQIGQTQLYEMLRHANSQHITLNIQAGNDTWPLFEVRQRPTLNHVNTIYDVTEQTLFFTTNLEQEWAGNCRFMVESLTNPFAPIIELGRASNLQKTHTLPTELPDGTYLLRLELDDSWLPLLPETAVQFTVGQQDSALLYESQLVQEIRNGHLISHHLSQDFILWWAELAAEGKAELTPKTLLQLATIPADELKNFGIAHLHKLWEPLIALQSIHNKPRWQENHGLLPSWIVLAHRVILKTAGRDHSLKVYPIQTLNGGLTGTGYGRWSLSANQGTVKTMIYVEWKPVSSTSHNMVHVEAGIPEDVPNQDWTAIDLLDCYGLHYCKRCGRLTGATSNSLPDEFIQEHLHGQATTHLPDITIPVEVDGDGYQLEAEFLPQRRGSLLLDIYEEFGIHIPRAEDYLPEPMMPSMNPLEQLENTGQWLGLIREIKRMGTNNPQQPFWSSASRLLSVWHNQKRVSDLGKIAVAFGLLLRSAAIRQKEFRKLLKDANLSETDCQNMLSLLTNTAPQHLQWGLTWAELLIVHSPQRN